jgi:hypothetical protein
MNLIQTALLVCLVLLSTVANFLDCRAPFHLFQEDDFSFPLIRTKASSPSDSEYGSQRSLMSDDIVDTTPFRIPHRDRLRKFKIKKNNVLQLWKYFSKIRESQREKFSPITRLPY